MYYNWNHPNNKYQQPDLSSAEVTGILQWSTDSNKSFIIGQCETENREGIGAVVQEKLCPNFVELKKPVCCTLAAVRMQ